MVVTRSYQILLPKNDFLPFSHWYSHCNPKKLPTWEGKVVEQKQKQFWNQWSNGNNLGACPMGNSEIFENKNHPNTLVKENAKQRWGRRHWMKYAASQAKRVWTSWVGFSSTAVPCRTTWGGSGCSKSWFGSLFFFQEADCGTRPHGGEAVWHLQVEEAFPKKSPVAFWWIGFATLDIVN